MNEDLMIGILIGLGIVLLTAMLWVLARFLWLVFMDLLKGFIKEHSSQPANSSHAIYLDRMWNSILCQGEELRLLKERLSSLEAPKKRKPRQ